MSRCAHSQARWESDIAFLNGLLHISSVMIRVRLFCIVLACGMFLSLAGSGSGPAKVVIAQISDTHLGERHSPHAAETLREAVKMINALHPDAVIVSGDIGESFARRQRAKTILKALTAPVYFVPGNHDFADTNGLALYRRQFGPDYYRFRVKNVEVLALDSQLLGNYSQFEAKSPPPLAPGLAEESERMLNWMAQQPPPGRGDVIIAVQHIPLYRDKGFPDAKPYWVVNPPYAQREADLLRRLGVKHLLAGHWHTGRVFSENGITIHVAPASSWLPFGGQLGFAIHTITANGDVHTQFVPLSALN
ncbi:MAG TPA: metallophosphoesterase [Verrucomicrobiae bacterium]|nr:metallophosphoesterase [Verrucomicrobiae bacterium]